MHRSIVCLFATTLLLACGGGAPPREGGNPPPPPEWQSRAEQEAGSVFLLENEMTREEAAEAGLLPPEEGEAEGSASDD
jgi:hypothetical protein